MTDISMHLPPGYQQLESGLLLPVDIRAADFGGQTTSEQPDPWLIDWANGGHRSHAGVRVTPQGSLALAAYYACLNVIAQDCAKLPLPVYRELDRGREKVRTDPLWTILQRRFNHEMTAYVGRYVMTHHAVGWGNGYGLILRDNSMTRTEGQIMGIYPIHPSRVQPKRDPDSGELIYEIYGRSMNPLFQQTLTKPETVPASDMIHLKGPSADGLVGFSVAEIAAESLGLSLAAQQYGASFFGESAIPSGILSHPGKLGEQAKQNLRASWEQRKHGTAVLEEGIKFEQLTIPPDQAQFIQTRQFQGPEICRWFRVNPVKIQDLTNAHFNNMEHINIEHVTDTMMPWHVMWEQELWVKFFLDAPDLYAKHDTRALMRGDQAARAAYYRTMVQMGVYTINDIRELEDMNPVDYGDEAFLQIQYAPITKIMDGTARQPRQGPVSPSDMAGRLNGSRNGHAQGVLHD